MFMYNKLKILLPFFMFPAAIHAQQIINLYPGVIPNSKPTSLKDIPLNPSESLVRRVINPTLEIYLPEKDKATGTAVVICPGGSYSVIVYGGEGVQTAKEFAKHGVAAFVLKYRLPNNSFQANKTTAPLQDAQQAIKLVRDSASYWNIDAGRVGIIGFCIDFFEQLRHHKVPVEMHIYPAGGHGFIFRQPGWTEPLFLWMKNNKWIVD